MVFFYFVLLPLHQDHTVSVGSSSTSYIVLTTALSGFAQYKHSGSKVHDP